MAAENATPVLCVHGIWDTKRVFNPLAGRLAAAGWRDVEAIDLVPNNGSADLPELARQVDDAAQRLQERTGAPRIDVVGFSMGSLASRVWIQRGGGKARVRRFVSISGPHRGTLTAYFSGHPGAVSMRYGSPLLRSLEADPDPWGAIEVHVFRTPLDLMIFPSTSSRLPKSSERTFWVAAHPFMLTDGRVLDAVQSVLAAPTESP